MRECGLYSQSEGCIYMYIHVLLYCVGRNKTQVLNSDDEIALALKKNKGTYL